MKKKIMILSLCTLGLFALVAFIFNSEVTKILWLCRKL